MRGPMELKNLKSRKIERKDVLCVTLVDERPVYTYTCTRYYNRTRVYVIYFRRTE